MRNKILLGILSIVILLSVATAVGTYTYAWLSAGQPVAFDAEGSAVAGYFYSGTGTKDDPYTLTNAKHVYNLAWLQYLGVFNNEKDENGNVIQFYFEIHENLAALTGSDTIDMKTYQNGDWQVIPPIGTTEYPFIGVFDGNGYTISNAVIANEIGADAITQYPPSVGQEVHNAEVIGFFGVIGEYNGTGVVSEDQLKVLGVSNLKLNNVTIQTSTEESLAGLLAGFVNGNLTNVLISSGTITAGSGVSAFQTTFTDGFVLNPNSALSGYSLIGDYNTTKINWLGGPLDGPTSDSGTNSGFGGSIDMLTLAKRVTYMFGAGTPESMINMGDDQYAPNSSIRDLYHIYGRTQVTKSFSYQVNDYFAFADNTYLPLNIETSNVTQEYYTAKKAEVLLNNTGYIVGNGNAKGMNDPTTQLWTVPVGKLYYALKGYTTNSSNLNNYTSVTYDNTKLQILTIDVNGNYHVIGDTYNGLTAGSSHYYSNSNVGTAYNATVTPWDDEDLGFTQYLTGAKVRDKITDLLKGGRVSALKLGSVPTTTNVLSVSVNLGSTPVNSLVKGTIHFSLDRAGVITMGLATISGTTMSAPYTIVSANMPTLYRVTRDAQTKNITNLQAIETIHTKDGLYAYNGFYEKSATEKVAIDNTWTPVYDYDMMGYLSIKRDGSGTFINQYTNSLFYFEIPVGPGEYVFGCQKGQSIAVDPTALILFMDIGANAGGSNGTTTPGTTANPTGYINGVYFMDSDGKPITQQVSNEKETVTTAVAFEVKLKDVAGASISYLGSDTNGNLNVVLEPWTGNLDVTLVKAEVKTTKKEDNTTGS